jgi:hypothetical protein
MAGESTLKSLTAPGWNGPLGRFEPCARYYDAMDFLLYLQEDLSYRADRVDHYLTLLWHPLEDRAIGVKLKGFRYLFQRIQAIVGTHEINILETDFVPLVSALEVAMTAGLGAATMAVAEQKRREEKYETARKIIGAAKMRPEELRAA